MPRKKKEARARKGEGSVVTKGTAFHARRRRNGQELYGPARATKELAKADLPELLFPDEIQAAKTDPQQKSLQRFLHEWMTEVRPREVERTTWELEMAYLQRRFWNTDLGLTLMQDLEVGQIEAHLCGLRKLRFAGKDLGFVETDELLDVGTIKRIGAWLHKALAHACSRKGGGILKTHPMTGLEYPDQTKSRPQKSLSVGDARSLVADIQAFRDSAFAFGGERLALMVETQLRTGLRRGELCALRSSGIVEAVEGTALRVTEALAMVKGGVLRKATKGKSVREVPLGEDLAERLKKHARSHGREWLFCSEDGSPVRPDNYSRGFESVMAILGKKGITTHRLRHTFVSLLIRQDVNLKTIMTLSGHNSFRMIERVYGEVSGEAARSAVSAGDLALFGTPQEHRGSDRGSKMVVGIGFEPTTPTVSLSIIEGNEADEKAV